MPRRQSWPSGLLPWGSQEAGAAVQPRRRCWCHWPALCWGQGLGCHSPPGQPCWMRMSAHPGCRRGGSVGQRGQAAGILLRTSTPYCRRKHVLTVGRKGVGSPRVGAGRMMSGDQKAPQLTQISSCVKTTLAMALTGAGPARPRHRRVSLTSSLDPCARSVTSSRRSALHHCPEQLLAQRHVRKLGRQWGQEGASAYTWPGSSAPSPLRAQAGPGRGGQGTESEAGVGGQDQSKDQARGPRAVGGSGWRRECGRY